MVVPESFLQGMELAVGGEALNGGYLGAFGLNRARQVMQQRVRIAEGISFDEAIAQAS